MKALMRNIHTIFPSAKGETLAESIVSLMVLAILLLAVTTMLQAALRITGISTQNAQAMQHNILNPLILADYTDSDAAMITFTVDGTGIEASHAVSFNKSGGIIAFAP